MEQPPNAVCIQFTMVKTYRICPIRIEIIHGRHRVVQIYTWAGPLYLRKFWIDFELFVFEQDILKQRYGC
jgi:hypothetical protein